MTHHEFFFLPDINATTVKCDQLLGYGDTFVYESYA